MSLDELEWVRRRTWLCPHHPSPGRHSFSLNETHLGWDFSHGRRETWWMSVRLAQWCGILPKRLISLSQPVCVSMLWLQSCPALWDPMASSPPGSSVHGILQARVLQWVATPSSRGSSQPRDRSHVSCVSRWVIYHYGHLGSPAPSIQSPKLSAWVDRGLGLGVEGHWARGHYDSERVLKKCSFSELPGGLH